MSSGKRNPSQSQGLQLTWKRQKSERYLMAGWITRRASKQNKSLKWVSWRARREVRGDVYNSFSFLSPCASGERSIQARDKMVHRCQPLLSARWPCQQIGFLLKFTFDEIATWCWRWSDEDKPGRGRQHTISLKSCSTGEGTGLRTNDCQGREGV